MTERAVRQADRDAAALVLHHMRGQSVEVASLVGEYYGPNASDLTSGLLRLVRDFASTISHERGTSSAVIVENAGRGLDGAGQRAAVAIAKAFSGADELALTRAVGESSAVPGIGVVFGLVDVAVAVLDQLVALGGKPVHGDPSLPLGEQWLQGYAYWIASEEAPDEGYTYERGNPQPCYVCGESAFGRDPEGRPHHVGCIPQE